MASFLSKFDIRPEEGRLAGLLFAEILLLGVGFNFLETSAFPLFLVEFSPQNLPTIYILNALVVIVITTGYLKLGQYVSFGRQLVITLAFLTMLVAGFWLALLLGGGRWVTFALPILFQVVVTLGLLGFWSMSNRLLTLRQSKRLIGPIGAGLWVAIILTGLLIPTVVSWLGTVNLLLLSTLGLGAALVLLIFIVHEYDETLTATGPTAGGNVTAQRSARSLLSSPYVALMFALTIVSWLAFYFVDNIFYNRVGAQFPTESGLSSFLGLYLAFLGVFTLFNNFVLTGFVINRFGVRAGLLVLPVSLLVVTGAMSVIGTGWGIVTILFWLATLNKVLDLGLAFSVDQSAQTILYQALPAAERTRIQTIDTGIVRMIAVGSAGVLLLLLNQALAFDVVQLSYVLLIIIVVWLVGVFLTGRAYPIALLQALQQHRLVGLSLSLDDSVTAGVVRSTLDSPNPGSALYALNLLLAHEPDLAETYLQQALDHPHPLVRQEALNRIAQQPEVTTLFPRVLSIAASDPDVSVRAEAIDTALVMDSGATVQELADLLDSPQLALRRAAVAGLLKYGTDAERRLAQSALVRLIDSPITAERRAATQLALYDAKDGAAVIQRLLVDPEAPVRRDALVTAGEFDVPDLWRTIVSALDDPETRQAAATVLISHAFQPTNQGCETAIRASWADLNTTDNSRVALARIIGHVDGNEAAELLLQRLDDPSDALRLAILEALVGLGLEPVDQPLKQLLETQLDRELDYADWLLAIARDCPGPELAYLRQVADKRALRARDRILLLLALLYDREALNSVMANIASLSEERRSYALEVLDVTLPGSVKSHIWPIVDADAVQHDRLKESTTGGPMPAQERVQAVFAGYGRSDPWLLITAIWAIGRLQCGTPAIEASLSDYAQHKDPILRETARQTLSKLGPAGLNEPIPGDSPMLSTIEKVILLKDVELFAEMPDELLAEVASLLTEIELVAGQSVFDKGDSGDSLYVIVDGDVRVHDGNQTINHLGESEVFGEMALLDTQPRMASVTTATDTVLLRLEQEPFFDLMESRSEVARGVIRVLSARLRGRVEEVTLLRDQRMRAA